MLVLWSPQDKGFLLGEDHWNILTFEMLDFDEFLSLIFMIIGSP
jgi:hypothetical protein